MQNPRRFSVTGREFLWEKQRVMRYCFGAEKQAVLFRTGSGCENGRQWKEYEVCDKMILIEKACMFFVQEL